MPYLAEQIKQHCDSLPETNNSHLYYYCHFANGQDEAEPFLRWVICQVGEKIGYIPGILYTLYRQGKKPDVKDLLNTLADVLTNYGITYIILDAIDESNPRESLLTVLKELIINPRFKNTRILASSREYPDIFNVMTEIATSISMDNTYVKEDIRLRVRSILRNRHQFQRWPLDLLNEVERNLSEKARGM